MSAVVSLFLHLTQTLESCMSTRINLQMIFLFVFLFVNMKKM